MADDTIQVGVELTSSGSEEAFIQRFASVFEKAMKGVGSDIGKSLAKEFRFAEGAVTSLNTELNQMAGKTKNISREFNDITHSIEAVSAATKGISNSIGKAFDPSALSAVNDQLNEAIRLRNSLNDRKSSLSPDEFRATAAQIDLLIKSLTVTKAGFSQAAQAAREFNVATSKAAVEASRAATAEQQAIKSRYVVDTQRVAANELATIRANAATSVAETRASTRQRVAAFELAGRSIVATERTIRAAFTGTSSIVSSAFNAIGRAGSTAATTVRNVFNSSNSSITNGYSSSMRKNTSIVQNEANQQTTIINRFASNAKTAISSVAASASTIAVGGILGAGIAKSLSSGFTRAANLEDAQRAFTVFLGDAEKSAKLTASILDLVTGTPFKLDQFTQAASQLLAFNIEAEKIPDVLGVIADAAAAQGGRAGETVDRLIRVFGQMSSAGKATTEDLNQLTEAGIPAFKILGNAMGQTTGDLRELITEGALPADVAIQALLDGIKNGSAGINGTTVAFDGLARSLGTTMRGSLANFGTAFARAGANVITKFAPAITSGLAAGTAAIDLIGVAFSRLTVAVTQAPAFKFLVDQISALTPHLVSLKATLTPLFDLIATGIVTVSQFGAVFTVFRNLPAIMGAVSTAIGAVLTPMNLFIAAAVLLTGYFQGLLRESASLRIAFSNFGQAVQSALKPVGAVLGELGSAVKTAIEPIIGGFENLSDLISKLATTALINLAAFVRNTVAPALREFADVVRTKVIPAVTEFIDKAATIASGALKSFIEWLDSTAIPVLKSGFATAWEVSSDAMGKFYDFASGTLVPFVRSNLIPTLIALSATIGAFAITGSLPFAGLVAGIGGLAAVLSNVDIREALVGRVTEAVDAVRTKVSEMIDDGVIKTVAISVLKVANKVGETLGNIATDKRLFAAVGAVAIAGAAIGASFLAGVVKGIAGNIPELVSGLDTILSTAFHAAADAALKGIATSPLLAGGIAAVLFGATQIAKLRTSAINAGKVVAQAMSGGAAVVPVSSGGAGSSVSQFMDGIFGTPAQLQAEAAKKGAQTQRIVAQQVRANQEFIKRLTGSQLAGDDGRLLNLADPDALRKTTDKVNQLKSAFGPATAAGAQFANGLANIKKAFTERDAVVLTSGVRQIGDGLKTIGPAVGRAAGITIGGALAGAVVSSALFDMKSSGVDKLQAGFGLAASAIGTGLAVGGGLGAAAGAAVVGVGLLTSKLQANSQASKTAAANAQAFASALGDVNTEAEKFDLVRTTIVTALKGASTGVQEALVETGFDVQKFVDAINLGTVEEQFGDLTTSGRELELMFRGDIKATPFVQGMLDAGVNFGTATEALKLLNSQVDLVEQGTNRAGLFGQLTEVGGIDISNLSSQILSVVDETKAAAEASRQYRDHLNELKDAQLGALQEQVDTARDGLEKAGQAADDAKTAVEEFLAGPQTNTFQEQVNESIIAVNQLATDLTTQIPAAGVTAGAATATTFQKIADEANAILTSGNILDQASAQQALQPLIDAALEAGGEGGTAAAQAIQDKINGLSTEDAFGFDFFDLTKVQTDAEAAVTTAQTALDAKEVAFNITAKLDPLMFDLAISEANTKAATVGTETDAGFAAGIGSSTAAQNATRIWANELTTTANDALGIHSPSTVFSQMGVFAAQGFANGLQTGSGAVKQAAASMAKSATTGLTFIKTQLTVVGRQGGQGLADGLRQSQGAVTQAAAALARAAVATFKSIFEVASPSKVTTEIGTQVAQGLSVGVTAGTAAVREAGTGVGNELMRGVTIGIERGGRIVTSGIDQLEEGAVAQATTVGDAIGQAIGFGLADSGPGVLGQIDSIIDDIVFNAQGQIGQLQQVGQAMASALFGKMGSGGIFGTGGSSAVDLQKKFFELQDIPSTFAGQAEKFGGFAPQFKTDNFIGRENRNLFFDAGTQVREYAQALIDAGRPLDNVIWETTQWRDQLINAARSFGATDEEINEMINTLGLSDGQLSQFVSTVDQLNQSVAAGTAAAEQRIKAETARIALEKARTDAENAQREAERAAEDAARAAKQTADDAADRKEREFRPAPAFRDLILHVPTGDPEAVALATANKVAFSISRS